MLLLAFSDRVLSVIGTCFAKVLRWSPIEQTVAITIEDCVDPWFSDRRVEGLVRAFDPTLSDKPLLIQLQRPLTYYAGGAMHDVDMIGKVVKKLKKTFGVAANADGLTLPTP